MEGIVSSNKNNVAGNKIMHNKGIQNAELNPTCIIMEVNSTAISIQNRSLVIDIGTLSTSGLIYIHVNYPAGNVFTAKGIFARYIIVSFRYNKMILHSTLHEMFGSCTVTGDIPARACDASASSEERSRRRGGASRCTRRACEAASAERHGRLIITQQKRAAWHISARG
eukprot:1164602-Pleurochrysis_carterae.AAC.1